MDKLAFPFALDQARFRQNTEMVGNGGRRDTAHGNDFAAIHLVAGADSLENAEAGFVRKGLRNTSNSLPVHNQERV